MDAKNALNRELLVLEVRSLIRKASELSGENLSTPWPEDWWSTATIDDLVFVQAHFQRLVRTLSAGGR